MTSPLVIAMLATLTVGISIYLLTVYFPLSRSKISEQLDRSLSTPDPAPQNAKEYEFNSQEFRAALLLRKLHIPAEPGEEVRKVRLMRLMLVGIGAVASALFGLPFVLVILLPVMLWFILDMIADAQVTSARRAIESAVATVFSDVAGMVLLTADAKSILEQAAKNLKAGGDRLLVPEIERVVRELQTQGRVALLDAEARVQNISPSLSLLFFVLRRLKDTGGTQFGHAFQLAADNLGAIMGVRQKIQAKADGARGTIRIIVGVFAFILAQMLLNPQMREAYTTPVAQVILAAAVGAMAFGYWFINGQIEEIM